MQLIPIPSPDSQPAVVANKNHVTAIAVALF